VARLRLADGLAEPPAGPAAEDVAGSVITWLFAPGSFAPLARLTTEGGHGLVTDQVGAPLMVLDGAGEVRAQLVTDSRGRAQVEGDATLCPWRFAGQYRDTETGLHYNRHRYYEADAGQYISRDPLGLRAGLRVYGYVADAGVQSDPLGLSPKPGDGCGGDESAASAAGTVPDDAFVVRGGVATPEQIARGIVPHRDVPGLTGFSAQSRAGASVEELAAAGGVGSVPFPHGQVSVTTAAELRRVGCDVVTSPGGGANHVTVTSGPASPAQISGLFEPRPNPARPR